MGKLLKKVLPVVLALMMLVSSTPVSMVKAEGTLGTIEALTPSQATITDDTSKDGKPMKVITFDSEFSLDWIAAEPSVYRYNDGWWIGAKITAPDLDLNILKTATYDALYYGNADWTTGKSFGNNRDSSDTDPKQFIQMWPLINEYTLNKARQEKQDVINTYRFDWDGDGAMDQYFKIVLKAEKVTLKKAGETVYPNAANLGTVSAITAPASFSITDPGNNYVTVTNTADVTLSWSQADKSIGRTKDAWWAGVKITAPAGADLNVAQIRVKGSGSWSAPTSFESAKDGSDWTGLWVPVYAEDENKTDTVKKNLCIIDWDGDGVYEQMIEVAIDLAKVTLDKTNLYAMDNAAPVFTEMPEDATTYVGDDSITLTGKVADEGTKQGDITYTSGLKEVSYSVGSIDAQKQTLSVNESGIFNITIDEEFEGYYYFFAKDNAGNESIETKVLVKHDALSPVLEDVVLSDENWTKDSLQISGTATDSLSGVDKVGYVKIDNDDGIFAAIDSADKLTNTTTVNSDNTFTLTIPADDYEGLIAVFAFDNVGRRSEAKVFSVKMDKSGVYSATANASSDWVNTDLSIEGSFKVKVSGLKKIEYKKDIEGSDFEAIPEKNIQMESGHLIDRREGNYSFVIPAQNYDGDYIIRFTDRANNIKEVTLTVHMDNSKPLINDESVVAKLADGVTPHVSWTNSKVIVSGEFHDEYSGIASVEYKKENDSTFIAVDAADIQYEDASNQKNGSYTFTIPAENYQGNYTVRFTDRAGNYDEKTVSIKVDVTAPEKVDISYQQDVFDKALSSILFHIYPGTCTVNLSAKDNLSGIKSFVYSNIGNDGVVTQKIDDVVDTEYATGSEELEATYSFSIPAQFRGYVSAYAVDNAENSNAPASHQTSDTVVTDIIPGKINAKASEPINTDENGINYYNETENITVEVDIEEENFMDGEYPEELKMLDKIGARITLKCVDDGSNFEKAYSIKNWTRTGDPQTDKWHGTFVIATSGEDKVPDGEYKVLIDYTDLAGNQSDTCTLSNIMIDTTAPVIEIAFADDYSTNRAGEGFFKSRTATITVEERNFDADAFEAAITSKNITETEISTQAKTDLDLNQWTHNGNTHTLKIRYTDPALYTFALNVLKDLAKNDYVTKPENEGSIFKKGTETPEAFTSDSTVPKDVEITYTQKHNVLDKIENVIFWFFNPKADDTDGLNKCEVTLTTTDVTSGLQYFTYSYNGTDTVVTENIADKSVAQEKGWSQDEQDASKFTYTFEIPAQFRGKVEASATDKSGNVTQNITKDEKTIVVDSITPRVSVAYPVAVNTKNGIDFYRNDVTVTVTVEEENFLPGEYSSQTGDFKIHAEIRDDSENKHGEDYTITNWQRVDNTDTWQGSFILSTEGDYSLTINYTDNSGNKADEYKKENLTIDKTAPVIEIEYDNNKVVNGRFFDAARKATFTVKEHDFYPEDIVSSFTVKNICGVDILADDGTKTLGNYYVEFLKDIKNWTAKGNNVYTINLAFNKDAIYNYSFSYDDAAKNSAVISFKEGSEATNDFVVDTQVPLVELSVNASVIRKILNDMTFGIFNRLVDADVTVTSSDITAGVETIRYASNPFENSIGQLPEKSVTAQDSGFKVDDTNASVVTYSFKVAPEFRNGLAVTVNDYAKNSKTVINEIINKNDNKTINGIIKDNIPGEVVITVDKNAPYASKDTFATDFDFTVNVSDNNSGINSVEVTLNGVAIEKDKAGKPIADYYAGDRLVDEFTFKVNSSQIKEFNNDDAVKKGEYTLVVKLTDNAGNETKIEDKDPSYTAYIDVFAPKVTDFSFKVDGKNKKAYVGDEAYKQGEKVDVVAKDSETYSYYFETNTFVTVYAYDYDQNGFNKHTSGISNISLIANSHISDEKVLVDVLDETFVQSENDNIGYSVKTFLVHGPFKGDLYAIAEDYAGNTPTNNETKGFVDPDYKGLMSQQFEGYVNPYDTVLEDAHKHFDTSSIQIIPKTAANDYQSYNYTYEYKGAAAIDKELAYTQSNVPLYNEKVSFDLIVEDLYSGIKSIQWSVIGQEDQDDTLDQSGRVTVLNSDGSLTGTDTEWTKEDSSQNIVTRMSKTITVENNSNDIVVLVELTDRAGNTSYDYYILGIDKTKPAIQTTLSGIASNKMYFNTDRTVTIVVTERNFNPELLDVVLSKNDNDISFKGAKIKWSHSQPDIDATDSTTHTATFTIKKSQEGDYNLSVSAADRAENIAKKINYIGDAPNKFVIDSTPSNIKVTMTGKSANEKYFFNTDRTVTIEVTDRNFDPNDVTVLINGSKRNISANAWKQDQSGSSRTNKTKNTTEFTISAEADYTFSVTCNDLADNAANKAKYATDDCERFTIDKTAPTAIIEKMVYQSANNGRDKKNAEVAIPILVTVKDKNIGNMYNGNAVTAKELTETLSCFTLKDNTQDGTFKLNSSKRDQVVYGSANLLNDGNYTLNLSVKDCAGNPLKVVSYITSADDSATRMATQSVTNGNTNFFTFSVNRKGSTFDADKNTKALFNNASHVYVQNVTHDLVFYETNVDKLIASKSKLSSFVQITKDSPDNIIDASKFIQVDERTDGRGWHHYTYTISKDLFADESEYGVKILSYDSAKNMNDSSLTSTFASLGITVDRTAPNASIIGVTSGESYVKTSQPVRVEISDNVLLETIEIYINGETKPILKLNKAEFDKYFEDGLFVWEYVFKESKEAQSISVVCYDAAGNRNVDEISNPFGYAVENFLVTTNRAEIVKFWIKNNLVWFILICIGVAAIITTPIVLVTRKKKKEDDE